ncbi:MAG TPA: PIG-L deacetylase family protein [Candidatus Nanoarchaeia archaeon]|nr:PIG-L deacetylase family protein [Candidatus Nanoarchaeia archaeon]
MNILIIAPHPDDEVLGCGGTIAKHVTAGDKVYLCIMTKGEEQYYGAQMLIEKRDEVLRVAGSLGISKVHFCDFIAANLDTVPQNQINHKLKAILDDVKPQILFIPHQGDLHSDHQLTFHCAMIAAKFILSPYLQKIYSYEVLSETEQSSQYIFSFVPTTYVNIVKELQQKLEALAIYTTELREYPHPRSVKAAEYKARARGAEVGMEAAEAFMLIRERQ